MKKQMKKIKVLTCASIISLSVISFCEIAQSMPRKLKGIKLTDMSSSSIKSYSSTLSKSLTTPSTSIAQTDGALPSTSSLPSSSLLSSASSSISNQGAAGGGDPAVRPKTYASHFPKPDSSSTVSLVSEMSSLTVTETKTHGTPGRRSAYVSGHSSFISIINVDGTETRIDKNAPYDPELMGPDAPKPSQWLVYPQQLKLGDTIYKPTFEDGVLKKAVAARPHIVVDMESVSTTHTRVTIVELSRTAGKGDKSRYKDNFMIDPNDPNYNGRNQSFAKLNRTRNVTLPNNKIQKAGAKVNESDLNKIREILRLID